MLVGRVDDVAGYRGDLHVREAEEVIHRPRSHRPGPSASRKQVPDNECVMSKINWKLIAFIGVLWWLIYSAPTEDSLFTMFVHKAGGTSASDDF